MRDFPNMSYAAFENTSAAMDQLINMLDQALRENEPLDLNRYEQRPYDRMPDQCRKLIELINEHRQLVEDQKDDEGGDPEEDGPDHGKLWNDTSAELA
jgi:hypothetical protein